VRAGGTALRVLRDLACSAALLWVAASYYLAATDISRSALGDELGARGLPTAYAALLAALAVLLLAKASLGLLRRRTARAADAPEHGQPRVGRTLRRAAGVLGIGVAYVLAVPFIGYPIAIAAVISAMAVYQGERRTVRIALVAILGAVGFWTFFELLLGIPMPAPWTS
jgi:putative tricarboxylic transport membrane protein